MRFVSNGVSRGRAWHFRHVSRQSMPAVLPGDYRQPVLRERLEELYGVNDAVVVPELIDLAGWRRLV